MRNTKPPLYYNLITMATSLNKAIENLYAAFESYSANAVDIKVNSCDCCVNDQEIRDITIKPLRELTEDNLGHLSRSAISTFGSVDHYKHFLPRILDLMTQPGSDLLGDFTCFEKLNYGEWETWPEAEQKAIHDYFEAFWETIIHHPKATTDQINETLFILLYYDFNERVFIEWGKSNSLLSTLIIVNNVLNGWCRDINNHIDDLKNWLYSDEVLNKLERAFFVSEDLEIANRISIVYTILEKKQRITFK